MTDCNAEVMPNQSWNEDGTADVTPQSECPISGTRELPVEHRAEGEYIIKELNYPDGVVILRPGNLPEGESAILPLRISSGNEVQISLNMMWPQGGVIIFT